MKRNGKNGWNGRGAAPPDERDDILAAFRAELEEQLGEPDMALEETLPQFDARFVTLEICALDYLQFMRIHSALSWENGNNSDQDKDKQYEKKHKRRR